MAESSNLSKEFSDFLRNLTFFDLGFLYLEVEVASHWSPNRNLALFIDDKTLKSIKQIHHDILPDNKGMMKARKALAFLMEV